MLKWLAIITFTGFVVLEVMAVLKLGIWLGVGWTIAWMIATVPAGLLVLRVAGLHAIFRIYKKLRLEVLPTQELMDMGMILLGALMLIFPGFISDAMGILLLLPPVRWCLRGCLCMMFGDLLPSPHPPSRAAASGDEVIEIRADE